MNRQERRDANIETKPKGLSRYAILLSIIVWPGSGQIVQKRFLAGVLFAGSFLICIGAALVPAIEHLSSYYKIVLDPENAAIPQVQAHTSRVAGFITAAIVIYVTNIMDFLIAQMRPRRDQTACNKAGSKVRFNHEGHRHHS